MCRTAIPCLMPHVVVVVVEGVGEGLLCVQNNYSLFNTPCGGGGGRGGREGTKSCIQNNSSQPNALHGGSRGGGGDGGDGVGGLTLFPD